MRQVKMEKRHFEFIARVLRESESQSYTELCELFADALAGTNPQFDRDRFLNACQPQED